RREMRLIRNDFDVRVQTRKMLFGRLQFWPPDVLRGVKNLPLQVSYIHNVEIDQAQLSDARRRQIETERRSQPAGADQQHLCLLQLELPFHADFGHDEVPAIAQHFLVRQLGCHLKNLRLVDDTHRKPPHSLLSPAPPAMEGTMLRTSVSFTGVCP